jgi:mono/diheme cytochrome c family protein
MMSKKIAMLLALVGVAWSIPVAAVGDGKTLFSYFRCDSCHGENGRGSASHPAAKPIAGMESSVVVESINLAIASGKHEDYADPGCGETPSTSQIRAIGDYVARLPR